MSCYQIFGHLPWKRQVFKFFVCQAESRTLLRKFKWIKYLILFSSRISISLLFSNFEYFLLFSAVRVLLTLYSCVELVWIKNILWFLFYFREFKCWLVLCTDNSFQGIIIKIVVFVQWVVAITVFSAIEQPSWLSFVSRVSWVLRWLDPWMILTFL